MYGQGYPSSHTLTIIYHISIANWDGVASAKCLYKSCETLSISSVGCGSGMPSYQRRVGVTAQFSPRILNNSIVPVMKKGVFEGDN